MDMIEVSAKTVSDAITEACQKLGVTSDKLDYEVVEEGSSGFLGIGAKAAVIKASVKKSSVEEVARVFLNDVFQAMNMEVVIAIKYNEEEKNMDIELSGNEMGVLIGKRGQTLDSLQYLVSLVVNKESEEYIHVKVDTENYRQRRKETLENLAKNIAYKVKRTKRSVSLEPMNPYERRIIHSKVAEIEGVYSNSIGEEPYRKVVISASQPHRDNNRRNDRKGGRRNGNGANRSYKQSTGFSTSFEREYKRSQTAVENTASDAGEFSKEAVETERNATLYGKIEL